MIKVWIYFTKIIFFQESIFPITLQWKFYKSPNFGQKSQKTHQGKKFKILAKNRNFGQKFKILAKNRNFGQKSKFWSNIEILVKNRNFGQKSKFWSKIEILVKHRNFGQNFRKKSKFSSKNRNFPQKIAIGQLEVNKFTPQ